MRQAFELAWANTYTFRYIYNDFIEYFSKPTNFSKSRPFCMHMDDIWFRAPVEIGSLLYFNSQIAYTQDNYIQTRVSAEVVNPKTGELSVTNVFHYTFKLKNKEPPFIIPKTYHESMMYLTGRRHFQKEIA